MDQNEFIEQEVQRRIARVTRATNEELEELRTLYRTSQSRINQQAAKIQELSAMSLCYGTVVKIQDKVNPNIFELGDEVNVIDPESPYYGVSGKVCARSADQLQVELYDEAKTMWVFSIGIDGNPQVKHAHKPDGTYIIVNIDGKPWEVSNPSDIELTVGNTVKILPDSKQIVDRADPITYGPIGRVLAVTMKGVEIEIKGDKKLVYNPNGLFLEEGDRVVVDSFSIIEKLERDSRSRYKLTSELNVSWSDIGGLEDAKQQCRDAIELPFEQPELYEYYGMAKIGGILFYGPPGCGKTMFAKAIAASIAKMHGGSIMDSGYIYVKSPEILDKYVGNTEAEIRELFERGRRHFRQHGYPAVLVFDEFDAIAPQRGTRRSSDVADTIVPMFLGEMDGVDAEQTRTNPIVVVMTNRADILDPAITRPGRISKHIKIDRPNAVTSTDILNICCKGIPFEKEDLREVWLAIAVQDIFSKTRLLYRVNNEHDFTLGDAISGAMLASIVEFAKTNALHRDLAAKSRTGINLDDLRHAVKTVFRQQRGVNHSFDLHDFAEKLGIQPQNIQVERCFGAA